MWGGKDLPYLEPVETAGEDAYLQYLSEVELTKEEIQTKLKEKYENAEINWDEEKPIEIKDHTPGRQSKNTKNR